MDLNTIVHKIRNDVKQNTLVISNYTDFQQMYPKLFTMIIKPDCDDNMVSHLLFYLNQRHLGILSEHNSDVEFGNKAVERYIKNN
tara:strand:+ start:287 stop:541 length:255 start_codon:yes stop_codon:yes gene_type:complete